MLMAMNQIYIYIYVIVFVNENYHNILSVGNSISLNDTEYNRFASRIETKQPFEN